MTIMMILSLSKMASHLSFGVLLLCLAVAQCSAFVLPAQPLPLRSTLSTRISHAPLLRTQVANNKMTVPRMMYGGGEIEGAAGGLLLAEEIFAQVAGGGIMIILSGVIGAFVVGSIANVDDLEATYQASNPENAQVNDEVVERFMSIEEGDLPDEVEKEMNDPGTKK